MLDTEIPSVVITRSISLFARVDFVNLWQSEDEIASLTLAMTTGEVGFNITERQEKREQL